MGIDTSHNSPVQRVEDNSLDSHEVEKVLANSLMDEVEDVPLDEDKILLLQDALNNETAFATPDNLLSPVLRHDNSIIEAASMSGDKSGNTNTNTSPTFLSW